MVKKSLFIFGLGYSSQAIARAAMEKGYKVTGTTRSEEKAKALRPEGIEVFTSFKEIDLAAYTHILSSIPPQENGDVVLALLKDSNTYQWLGHLSTTGVYGDWDGAWVDEQSELRPSSERLKRRISTEKEWLAHGAHVFRLAGIYGPGRSALDDVHEGAARRIDKPGQVFSRIHVEDIAQVVVASMEKPNPGNMYNVCDDLPAPQAEVVEYACALLNAPLPPLIPFEQAQLTPMGREFYSANRRVKNDKIKNELSVQLHYPTYKEGLKACGMGFAKIGGVNEVP